MSKSNSKKKSLHSLHLFAFDITVSSMLYKNSQRSEWSTPSAAANHIRSNSVRPMDKNPSSIKNNIKETYVKIIGFQQKRIRSIFIKTETKMYNTTIRCRSFNWYTSWMFDIGSCITAVADRQIDIVVTNIFFSS